MTWDQADRGRWGCGGMSSGELWDVVWDEVLDGCDELGSGGM